MESVGMYDPIDHGILTDQSVQTEDGVELRMVQYINPLDGKEYELPMLARI